MEFGNHVEKAVDFIAETPLFKLITGQDTGQGSGNSIFANIKGFATERLGLGYRIGESFSAMPSLGGAYPVEQPTISKEPSIGDKVQGFDPNTIAFVEALKGKGFSASQEPTFSNIGMAADTNAVDFSGRNAIADVNPAEIGRFAPQANRVGLRQSQQIGVG
jgi:hypothetical protein